MSNNITSANLTSQTRRPSAEDEEGTGFAKLFLLDQITSELYGPNSPPKDWADISFLVPHEALRREMAAMNKSVTKLNEGGFEPWQALFFSEWFVDHFAPAVRDHHHNEEVIYFPWVAARAELPEKKLSDGHEELMDQLNAIGAVCETVINKGAVNCVDELSKMKEMMLDMEKDMLEHLKEEETDIPPLLRANFTKEEEDVIIQQLAQSGGLSGMRLVLPMVLLAMKEWATPTFCDEFTESLPLPIRHLVANYFLPDEINCVLPKRDAPFLAKEPTLNRVKCCKIPFCCPCII